VTFNDLIQQRGSSCGLSVTADLLVDGQQCISKLLCLPSWVAFICCRSQHTHR